MGRETGLGRLEGEEVGLSNMSANFGIPVIWRCGRVV